MNLRVVKGRSVMTQLIRGVVGALLLAGMTAGVAAADVNVVTTTETLAALTRAVWW